MILIVGLTFFWWLRIPPVSSPGSIDRRLVVCIRMGISLSLGSVEVGKVSMWGFGKLGSGRPRWFR